MSRRRGDDDDDFDDEEAEMARMRQNKQFSNHAIAFGRNQRDAPTVVPPTTSHTSHTSHASRSSYQEDDEEPQYVDADEGMGGEFREMFPMGFGKKSEKFDTAAALAATRREGAIVVGPTRPGPARPTGPVGPAKPAHLVGPAKPTGPVGPAKPAHLVGPAKPGNLVGPAKPAAREEGLVGPPKPAAREEGLVGPPRPPPGSVADDSDDDDDDEDDDHETAQYEDADEEVIEEDLREKVRLPVTHEISLKGHTRPVSALTWDPSGARLLTGGFDYIVKLWDFGGMDSSLRSFRELEPCGGHQIVSLQFSNTGDRFLVAPGAAQPKIFDRDGFEQCEFIKGDQYLTDMTHTKGHVAAVTNAVWHPNIKQTVLTSSVDGTIRLWDVNDVKKQKHVLKTKNQRGTRTGVQYGTFGLDGNLIVAACQDGSLQLWSGKGPFGRPDQIVRDAHVPETETSCVNFSLDGHTMITRGGDDTLKVWDLRNLTKGPVAQVTKLPNYYAQTDCIFSPDEKYIVTGTSIKRDEGSGLLIFFDKHTLRPVTHFGMSKTSVIRILWHKQLNQIVVGGSDSVARVLYDPELSNKGAMMCVGRAPRKQDPFDYTPDRPIQAPHALDMFKPEPSGKRKRDKDRKDPKKSKRPDIPQQGPGTGRGSMTTHLLKQMGSLKPVREEDPREAILKYAKAAEENPTYFGVYKQNQPKPVFDTEPEEGTEEQK